MYVPLSVESVRAALAERERVGRCVPGLQLDAGSAGGTGLRGRLRVRAGGSTITYRGRLTVTPVGDGFSVKASGEEVRGSGTVKLTLRAQPRTGPDGTGTRLVFAGKVTGDGRLADVEDKAAASAGRRLLDRFCAALAESVREEPPTGAGPDGGPEQAGGDGAAPGVEAPEPADAGDTAGRDAGRDEDELHIDARQAAGLGEPDDNDPAIPNIPGPEKGERDNRGTAGKDRKRPADDDTAREDAPGDAAPGGGEQPPGRGQSAPGEGPAEHDGSPAAGAGGDEGGDEPEGSRLFEAEIPPPSLDPLSEGGPEAADVPAEGTDDERSGAEAAHARRTMIGRSAEEVDHAPPRGRYAPEPPPEAGTAGETLRWAAPAAALALAGAVVLSRALRRRR